MCVWFCLDIYYAIVCWLVRLSVAHVFISTRLHLTRRKFMLPLYILCILVNTSVTLFFSTIKVCALYSSCGHSLVCVLQYTYSPGYWHFLDTLLLLIAPTYSDSRHLLYYGIRKSILTNGGILYSTTVVHYGECDGRRHFDTAGFPPGVIAISLYEWWLCSVSHIHELAQIIVIMASPLAVQRTWFFYHHYPSVFRVSVFLASITDALSRVCLPRLRMCHIGF